ncbi:MAG: hypothetical protein OET79_02620 [Nitrospirota bacterium]|nr:hypothetical protein [Nitrospirota bacterium]
MSALLRHACRHRSNPVAATSVTRPGGHSRSYRRSAVIGVEASWHHLYPAAAIQTP